MRILLGLLVALSGRGEALAAAARGLPPVSPAPIPALGPPAAAAASPRSEPAFAPPAAPLAELSRLEAAWTARAPRRDEPAPSARERQGAVFDGSVPAVRAEPDAVPALSLSLPGAWLAAQAPLLPIAYETLRLARSGPPPAAPGGETPRAARRLWQFAAASVMTLPMALFAAGTVFHLGAGTGAGLIVAGLMAFAAAGWRAALAHSRSDLIGVWQASHDQRYRVGHDGAVRDVRGRRYGEDRYDERVPGRVSGAEGLAIRASAAWFGGHLLAAAGGGQAPLAYGLALTALWVAADLRSGELARVRKGRSSR